MNLNKPTLLLALGLAALSPNLHAREAGQWEWTIGAHVVDPKSGNGSLASGAFDVDVGSNTRPTFTGEYFFNSNWGLEVLASLPFQHDISLNGAEAASTKHLPPTVSLQYHGGGEKVSPFIGLGVNFTKFFSVDERGPLAGTNLDLDDSWGLALHAGIDFAIGEKRWIRIDARKIDIDTDVSLNGTALGTVNIDPMVYGAAFVWSF